MYTEENKDLLTEKTIADGDGVNDSGDVGSEGSGASAETDLNFAGGAVGEEENVIPEEGGSLQEEDAVIGDNMGDKEEHAADGSPEQEGGVEEEPNDQQPDGAASEKPASKRTVRRKPETDENPTEETVKPKKATTPARKTREAAKPDTKRAVKSSAPADPDELDVEEMTLAKRKQEAAAQRQRWRREREMTATLDVDGTSMVDDSDGFDEKAATVYQAKNTRMICCGQITGVKFSRGAGHYVEAEYNGFRVLIPFQEMDVVLERQPGDSDNDYDNKTITAIRNMVGAEIEFIIIDIDENEELASASRRMAAEDRRRKVLNGVNRDGEYYIYPSRKVVARVLDVHPFYAWVEVAGWRARLSASELRAEYVEDMTTELANGQRIVITITDITRDRAGKVTDMRISMRDDEKEKRDLEKAMAGINIGDIIRCEVVGRSSKVIRLKTHNGARAFCYIAKGLHGRYIPKLDESVTIKVIKKTVNPRTGNPVLQGNILRRSVKPGML